jgi:hypothetical protein
MPLFSTNQNWWLSQNRTRGSAQTMSHPLLSLITHFAIFLKKSQRASNLARKWQSKGSPDHSERNWKPALGIPQPSRRAWSKSGVIPSGQPHKTVACPPSPPFRRQKNGCLSRVSEKRLPVPGAPAVNRTKRLPVPRHFPFVGKKTVACPPSPPFRRQKNGCLSPVQNGCLSPCAVSRNACLSPNILAEYPAQRLPVPGVVTQAAETGNTLTSTPDPRPERIGAQLQWSSATSPLEEFKLECGRNLSTY